MSIPYTNKVNEQAATPVINELHTIGILGTATFASGLIRLVQVPQGPAPAVHIPGYVEILSGSPSGVQFLVNYTTGVVSFDPSNNGNTVIVSSYNGLGSEIAAEDVNELQNPVSAVVQQTILYNWPSAPTVSWALTPGSVTNATISSTAAISLTKLQALVPNRVPVSDVSGILTSSSVTATTLGYLDATSSIQTQLNGKQPSGTYISSLTGDVSATGPGASVATVNSVGGSSATAVNTATIAANGATNLDTVSTLVKRDSSGNFAISSINFKNQGAAIFEDTQVVPNKITLEGPSTVTASYTIKLPPAQGTNGTVLTNDGLGNLSWSGGSGSGVPGGVTGDLQYNNAGNFGGATITTNGNTIQFPNPILNQIQFLDNIHASLGASPNGNTLYLLGPVTLQLATINGNVFIKDNGLNTQITTNPSGIADASAVLDISTGNPSNFLGFLPPKMSTAQRDTIGTPAQGTATVVNYAALSGAVLTVGGTALTEGVNWFATTSNTMTASSLASAVNALATVTGTFNLNVVNITGKVVVGSNSITLTTSDPTNLPVSGSMLTGEIDPTPGLEIYNTSNNQWNGWNGTSWVILG
jgi:hypothetical protein